MFDLKSFFVGLMMSETNNPSSKGKSALRSNIALQDILFCQQLRNLIQELQDYVDSDDPSPEDFMRKMLPDTSMYEKPYTSEEAKQIEYNAECISRYVRECVTSEWHTLPVVKRIWFDETYTPDFEHLDLLFALETNAKPVKRNGVLYEYDFYGKARNFFTDFPSSVVSGICQRFTVNYLREIGCNYDYSRFEYNEAADKRGCLPQWRAERRVKEYSILYKTKPSFCRYSWSDMTKEITRK